MDNKNKKAKLKRKIRFNIFLLLLSAILCIVSTYAWFVGLSEVKVSTFDVSIKVPDSLSISLDGIKFNSTLLINSNNYNDINYSKTNTWGTLSPVSTIGEFYTTGSLIFYKDKNIDSELIRTKTYGGYKVFSERINNNLLKEGETNVYSESDYYVTFDIFVRNSSDNVYTESLNILDEDIIYLTRDSSVTVTSIGSLNTGLENSVRVAFLQLGRVDGSIHTVSSIMNEFDCNGNKNVIIDGNTKRITNICRTTIWEPNDINHNEGAISWYNEHCKIRIGDDTRLKESYSDLSCNPIYNNNYYTTYAINSEIEMDPGYGVDVYDGYNGYSNTIGTSSHQHLSPVTTFRDSENLNIDDLPFISLQPNSITKIRVYIWLEGQDIDNYDFASTGRAVNVNFNLSKESSINS